MSDAVDPLDEQPYDPLDEPYDAPIPRGIGDEGEPGFGTEARTQEDRAAQLLAKGLSEQSPLIRRKKKAFLIALAETGIITHAAARAGWTAGTAQYHRDKDKQFSDLWDESLTAAIDGLELEAHRRAKHGVAKAVWDKGGKEREPGILGYDTVHSDRLLELLLKAKRPEQYRERHEVDHKGSAGGGVLVVPAQVPLDEWCAAAARQQAQYREKQED